MQFIIPHRVPASIPLVLPHDILHRLAIHRALLTATVSLIAAGSVAVLGTQVPAPLVLVEAVPAELVDLRLLAPHGGGVVAVQRGADLRGGLARELGGAGGGYGLDWKLRQLV